MKVGILKPFRGTYRAMLDIYKKILDHNHIEYVDLDINDPGFWDQVKTLDLFLAKISQTDDDLSLAAQIIPVINNVLKINCFPNYMTVWHYDDKVKQYYLLKQFGFPLADAYIFWDKKEALKWIDKTPLPVVFKLKGGAGSSNVKLIKSRGQGKNLIKHAFGKGIHPYYFDFFGKIKAFNYDIQKISKWLFKPLYKKYMMDINSLSNYTRQKNYVYFQKFMPGNDYDTRVAIVGKRAFSFKRFVRPNDFRASGSDNYDMRKEKIDMRMVKIAFDVSFKLGFQSMAYDFIYDEHKNPVIVEISYTYGDYPEFSTGYWDENLVWHDGYYIPEYLELVDSLNMPELKQPDIHVNSPYQKAKTVK